MDGKRWVWFAALWTTVIVSCFLIIGTTDIWLRYDIAAHRAEFEAKLARAGVTARSAQDLAQHDRAMVTAVCEAFHRRDLEDAIHTAYQTDCGRLMEAAIHGVKTK
jgi:hypothetical protein